MIEVVSRPLGGRGFTLVQYRWAVERTFAWLGRCRIQSKESNRLTDSSEAQVQISMIQLTRGWLPKAKYRYNLIYKCVCRKAAA